MIAPASDRPVDVTIVGAGIVGVCCALSLLERGAKVSLLDKAGPAEAASHGNAGVISPWSCVPQSMPGLWRSIPGWLLDPKGPVSVRWSYLPSLLPWAVRFLRAGRADRMAAIADAMDALNRPNVEMYRRHLAGTGQENLLRDSWYVHVYRDPAGASLDGLGQRLRIERGAPIEIVDADGLRAIEPALSKGYRSAVVIKDQARAMHPGQLGKALAEKAAKLGAEVQCNPVHRLTPAENARWRLETNRGVLHASTGRALVDAAASTARHQPTARIRARLPPGIS